MAPLEIIASDQENAWCAALGDSQQHDFYHLPRYHRLAEEQGEGRARLFVYREGEWTIALPLLLRCVHEVAGLEDVPRSWSDATSVYGYAGPLASHAAIPAAVVQRFQAALRAALEERKVVAVFSRLHPLFAQQEALLAGLGECPALARTIAIDLTLSVDEQRRRYRRNHKEGINRLRRQGLSCLWDTDGTYLEEFIAIYHETMRRVDAAPAYFFPRDYFLGLRTALPSAFHLFVCRHEGRVISAGLFIECDGILQYHLGATRDDALKLGSIKLVFDEVRLWAMARGLRVFHLGGGVTPRPDDSLFHFKQGFSDRSHDFRVWRWVLDPLAYQQLCQAKAQWRHYHDEQITSPGYFPEYRACSCPLSVVSTQNTDNRQLTTES